MDGIEPIKFLESLKLYEIQNTKPASVQYTISESNLCTLNRQNTCFHLSRAEYAMIMKNRPLIKYRPIKNLFTKKGDKVLLAKGLGIEVQDVDRIINTIIDNNFIVDNINYINDEHWERMFHVDENTIQMIRTYVYRHGKKEQVLKFLDNELSDMKLILKKLYHNLNSELDSVEGFYSRPCHILDNVSARRLYDNVSKRLIEAKTGGFITDEQHLTAINDTLKWIYKIQNNSDIKKAFKFIRKNS